MKIVFLGPPGSGKGTQSQLLCKRLHIPHISTGDMLREEARSGSELGKRVQKKMNKGALIDDGTIGELVVARLKHADCLKGFILDGIPRTVGQAEYLQEHGVQLDLVIELYCSEEELIQRLSSRRVHLKSGRIYNILSNPPKQEGKDDITGEPLDLRSDDKIESVRRRIEDYTTATQEVCAYYSDVSQKNTSCRYFRIDAEQPAEDISKQLQDLTGSS